MAKATYLIPAGSVEPGGEDDTLIINDNPAALLAANGVINQGPGIERMLGKKLFKRTDQPIKGLHLTYTSSGPGRSAIGVWVESRTKLVFFPTFAEFENVAVVFP